MEQTIHADLPTPAGDNDLGLEIFKFLHIGCSVRFEKYPYPLGVSVMLVVKHPNMQSSVKLLYDCLQPQKSLTEIKDARQLLAALAHIENNLLH